jgi:cell division protease FtsH
VDDNYARVRRMLTANADVLHRLAKDLIEKENLSGEEVDRIIQGAENARGESSATEATLP